MVIDEELLMFIVIHDVYFENIVNISGSKLMFCSDRIRSYQDSI